MKFNLTFTEPIEETLEKVPDRVLVSGKEGWRSAIYEIEVNTLEDILRLALIEDSGIVIHEGYKKWDGEHDYTIEIYNDYRE